LSIFLRNSENLSVRMPRGGIRSAVEETDWHELEKERFAASIADRINRAALANAFDQIVIVAPPKILGELRREFAKEPEAKIVAEIPKDLTNHTILQIERLLTVKIVCTITMLGRSFRAVSPVLTCW
jgi:protein required for attachment to host cells